MKLTEWFETSGELRHAFAARVYTSPGYITDLCQGRTKPSLAMASRIMQATNGKVRPEDFFDDAPSSL